MAAMFGSLMRSGIGTYILIILLVLMLFGLISVGDVLSLVFYIILGIVILGIIGVLAFRYKMNRLRRQMEENGETFRGYSWGSGHARQEKRDGEVTIQRTQAVEEKKVSSSVGDYVEYEDINDSQSR